MIKKICFNWTKGIKKLPKKLDNLIPYFRHLISHFLIKIFQSQKQVKYKLDRDFLGKKDVSFEDRLINFNQCDNKFYPKLTETAGVAFELRPVKVEF